MGHNDIHESLDCTNIYESLDCNDIHESLEDNRTSSDIHDDGDSDIDSDFNTDSNFDGDSDFDDEINFVDFGFPVVTVSCPSEYPTAVGCPVMTAVRPGELLERPVSLGHTMKCPDQSVACPTTNGGTVFVKLLSVESGFCENGGTDNKQFDATCAHVIDDDIGGWDEDSSGEHVCSLCLL